MTKRATDSSTEERWKGDRFVARLAKGTPFVIGEGYVFELERRGYVQAGAYVPSVVIEHPQAVKQLYTEYTRAGSDCVLALTYYAHRQKLAVMGLEGRLEEINATAIRLAHEVADEYGVLVVGNTCNTNAWEVDNEAAQADVKAMFVEQVAIAKQGNCDVVLGETFDFFAEAMCALKCIKDAGMRAIINLAIHSNGTTFDGLTPADACKQLADAGADVVGVNCARGPNTILPLVAPIVAAVAPTPVSCVPVLYRTTDAHPCFQTLRVLDANGALTAQRAFPLDLDPHVCTRAEAAEFAKRAVAAGAALIGTCCGGAPHHVRAMSMALGNKPPSAAYDADMSKHVHFGDNDEKNKKGYRELYAAEAVRGAAAAT